MALPGDRPLELYVGDTRTWRTTVYEDDGTTPMDLTGKTWLAQVRANDGASSTVMATFTVDSTDAATGVLVLTLPAAEAANLVKESEGEKKPAWDLQGTEAGEVRTYLRGKVTVRGDVSRA